MTQRRLLIYTVLIASALLVGLAEPIHTVSSSTTLPAPMGSAASEAPPAAPAAETVSITAPNLAGFGFAEIIKIAEPTAEVLTTAQGQRALRLTAKAVGPVPPSRLAEGWVSWSFIPAQIQIADTLILRNYAFDHFFGFTNQTDNLLIDDGLFIPDEPARIAIFSWQCVTAGCDTLDDMPSLAFVSQEAANYRAAATGTMVKLTPTAL